MEMVMIQVSSELVQRIMDAVQAETREDAVHEALDTFATRAERQKAMEEFFSPENKGFRDDLAKVVEARQKAREVLS